MCLSEETWYDFSHKSFKTVISQNHTLKSSAHTATKLLCLQPSKHTVVQKLQDVDYSEGVMLWLEVVKPYFTDEIT
jgi:hypothetical protein